MTGRDYAWSGDIRVAGVTEAQAERMLRAIQPESGEVAGKSQVTIEREGDTLRLKVAADSTAAFRAALNSYLRWLSMIEDVERIAGGPLRPRKNVSRDGLPGDLIK